jgi:DNA-binding Lrp family transcriptional regulator
MERTFWQKLEGTTETILNQLKKLIDEGNIRRIVVKHRGRTVAEFPLTAGVIGAVIAPVAAAIGALSALLAECSIEVEKIEVDKPEVERPLDKTEPGSESAAVNL